MSNQDLQHVVTGKVRLSYVHTFTPFASKPNAEAKYSVTLLIPKSDVATMQRIGAALEAATQQGVQSKWNGVRPPMVLNPIYDGDGVRPSDGMSFSDECKGHWVMTAADKNRPEVVDINLNPIIDQTQIYSGIYARVSIRFFAYTNTGKKGIGCGLRNIQKLEDGEPLAGSRTNAADDFGGGPGSYPQQPAYTPPVQPQGYPAAPGTPAYGYPAAPGAPTYLAQPPAYPPAYPTQPPAYPPAYPTQSLAYPPQQPVQLDPITGKPINGGVMGL